MAKTTTKKEQLVINQVIVQAPQRRVYDVGDWRTAMRSADTGRAKYLYDLFDEILIDGVLSDAIDKRINAVLNAGLTFVNSKGEELAEISDMLNSSAGDVLLRNIMAQRFFGRSGVEMSFSGGFQCTEIKPKYIDLQHQAILLNDLGDKSVSYADNDRLLILGKPLDYGLLLKTAPFAIYKRGGFGDYAQWIELFGMPQRIGKYNTYDPESRVLLEQAFKNAGSAPYIIVPKEAEIETLTHAQSSGKSSYDEFREACNEEMLITILGQTLTTVQGERGARSLGEVHMEVESSKHAGDIRFVERVLNERVRPMLEARGFNLQGGKFIFPKEAEPLSVAEIVSLSEIIQIPTSFIHEKYGIPMPKDGEEIARKQTQEVIGVKEGKVPQEPATKKTEKIQNLDERGFFQRLWDFFAGAPQVGATMNGTALTLSDAKTLDERLIARTPNTKGFDTELFEYLSNSLITAFREGWDSPEARVQMADKTNIALQYSIEDDALKTAMEMNLYHFSAAKTLAEIQELNQIFRESSSFAEFEKRARVICSNFNNKWARTEYDTAYLSAQSASRYQQLIRKDKVFPYWQYRAIHDEHTRPEHMMLDGVVLPTGDKLWNEIYPPNGWNCRCRVEPLMKNEFNGNFDEMRERVYKFKQSDEWTRSFEGGWGINRAKQGLVFSENQFYIKKLTEGKKQILNNLNHADYGLPTIEECIEAATKEMPIYNGTAEDWYTEHSTLVDYSGRTVEVDKNEFITHTTKPIYIKQGRIKLLSAVIEILKNPDEVWINKFKKELDNVNFIKYYKGRVINVICRQKNLKYKVHTWFEIKLNSEDVKEYRSGLLIKK